MNIIGPHDHRAIAHPKSALSWGNASRDARQAMPGSNLKIILVLTTVQRRESSPQRVTKSFFRSREVPATPMPHRHKIKTGPADFGAHIAQPGTRFWSALPRSYMNRSWVRPARIRNLGFRRFAQPPKLKPFNIDCFFDRIT